MRACRRAAVKLRWVPGKVDDDGSGDGYRERGNGVLRVLESAGCGLLRGARVAERMHAGGCTQSVRILRDRALLDV